MRPVRVLIVDDSRVIRRLVADVLSTEQDIAVVGMADSAAAALSQIEALQPDLVTLDVEMPDRSGLDALVDIRARAPRLPVIMFSSLTQRAAATTLDALARGATDYVTKPANTGDRAASIALVRAQLVPKIRALAGPTVRARATAPAPSLSAGGTSPQRVEVVVVGCSTGGPNALSEVFRNLPRKLDVPVLVVQHMPPLFTQLLAERLGKTCPLRVCEASDGQRVEAGQVYVAPGNHHLELERDPAGVVVRTHQGPHENSCRPAVDVLFRSAAAVHGGHVLAVVLTGMGQDGLRGCERLRAAGAQVLVQDEATSVVWGMPGFVAQAGLADDVLPLGDLAAAITRRVRGGERATPSFPADACPEVRHVG
ncbi:MAG: chemotaxis-specific protein-glutamate methyltransferase CheB [Myxococcaceae bacterium]|nr:chemotaxis-specific protein-glutamate methyltransferase CheB [Myxococcaceae bacterium]